MPKKIKKNLLNVKVLVVAAILLLIPAITSINADAKVVDSKQSTVSVTFTLPDDLPTVQNTVINDAPAFSLAPDTSVYAKSLTDTNSNIVVKDNGPQELKEVSDGTYQIVNNDVDVAVTDVLTRIVAGTKDLSLTALETNDPVEIVFVTGP